MWFEVQEKRINLDGIDMYYPAQSSSEIVIGTVFYIVIEFFNGKIKYLSFDSAIERDLTIAQIDSILSPEDDDFYKEEV